MPAGICSIHFRIYRSMYILNGAFQGRCTNNLDSLQENIHTKVWLQMYWNYTFAWVFFCEYATTPFIENSSGKLLLYIFLNMEVINVEVLSKQVKNCLKYILIIKTLFLTLYVSFTRWPNISFQKPMSLLKKHKRGHIYTSLVPELQNWVLYPVVG